VPVSVYIFKYIDEVESIGALFLKVQEIQINFGNF
jgi:hypothetical protein